uniref:Uncharacterized protein n=1 Tax=Monodelphis domestica TaxID=13616 RepID=A0A5F8GER4_MONDO
IKVPSINQVKNSLIWSTCTCNDSDWLPSAFSPVRVELLQGGVEVHQEDSFRAVMTVYHVNLGLLLL